MTYKTMVLAMLEELPRLHQQLRTSRRLLSALDHYGRQLKAAHSQWQQHLKQRQPPMDEIHLRSAALEFATAELQKHLLMVASSDVSAEDFLDAAMAFRPKPTPSE